MSESEGHKSQLAERIKQLEAAKQLVAAEGESKYQDTIARFEGEIE